MAFLSCILRFDLAKNGFRIKVEVRFVIQRNDIAVFNGLKSLPDFVFAMVTVINKPGAEKTKRY